MTPLKISSPDQFRWLVIVAALFGMVCLIPRFIEVGFTNNQPQDTSTPTQQKQLFMDVPAKLPLKVKVKNLDSKAWVHDLEVEVTNTSNKPIYFLDFYIILPEIIGSTGSKIGFWLKYGRGELVDFSTPLDKNDVPILPGEKHIFKIPESSAKGWDKMKVKEGKPEPKRIQLVFQGLNFGDGTGFSDAGATPVDIHKKTSRNKLCLPPPKLFPILTRGATFDLPASFLPVKFFLLEEFESLSDFPPFEPDLCCTQGGLQLCKTLVLHV